MRIDLMEHADLIRGAAEVEESSDGVRCRRMTPAAMEFYSHREELHLRSHFSTGVRLALVTDSAFIALRLKLGHRIRDDAFKVDVLIDCSECHTFSPDDDLDEFCFTVEMPDDGEEDHEVEILLPIYGEASILEFELADGALFRPLYGIDPRMIFLGDSVTMGTAASSPLRSWAAYLAAALGSDYVNWGVGSARMEREVGELALGLEWQQAVVAYGINDYAAGTSAKACADELAAMLAALASRPGVKLYVVTPLLWSSREKVRNEAGDTPDDFRREIARAAAAFPEVTVVDGKKLLKAGGDGFDEDGIHPSDAGMSRIAEQLHAVICDRTLQ